jgi:uncharacterized protein YjbI with pentapeptide repeats
MIAMDRNEAIRLLRSGDVGIAEWNQRRQKDEEIPDLSEADLYGSKLHSANLSGAILRGSSLCHAILHGADLSGANLMEADLRGARLAGANLAKANLRKANFQQADLRAADLSDADLGNANCAEADLDSANLSRANLSGVNLIHAILVHANLSAAKLSDCRVFGASVWRVKTDDQTEQKSLIISFGDDPILTVDNLKIAQFIYLLLDNNEIRGVIDTITSKVVLILGRFTPERKALLDAIREELRRRNYLPVMFDFEKPGSRSYTETITTLARMSRFIIADVTDATEVRLELAKIVPDLPSVPVQPLVLASATEYVTFDDLRYYSWVLKPFRYTDLDNAITSLSEMVLAPAEAKVAEQRG